MTELFKIKRIDGNTVFMDTVEGEHAFDYKGFRFFVREAGNEYAVSDVMGGQLIARLDDKLGAIELAKKRISENFDSYIEQLKVRRRAKWRYSPK